MQMNSPHAALIQQADGSIQEPVLSLWRMQRLKAYAVWATLLVFVGLCFYVAEVDLVRLWEGLPRMGQWMMTAFPPNLTDWDAMLMRAFETVAIATVATLIASAVSFPLSTLMAHNTRPWPWLASVLRTFANSCRAIDTVVFAILFVAAVGLGPFAGVLGMIVHSIGVIAKLNSEAIETLPSAPMESAVMSGANRLKVMSYAMLPTAMPNLASTSLYMWEANVRTSTVLGLVGAGGIGMEIKAAIDLLDFQKLFTLTVILLLMVGVIDRLSVWARRRLV